MRFVGFLISSGSLIGVMFLLRAVLRRSIPPGILYALWLIPAVRLLIPFTLFPVPLLPESAGEVSVFFDSVGENSGTDIADSMGNMENTEIAGEDLPERGTKYIQEQKGSAAEFFGENDGKDRTENAITTTVLDWQKTDLWDMLLCIWLSGSVLCGCYVFWVNGRFKQRVRRMEQLSGEWPIPVYIGKGPASPCLFGLFHPCILLPEHVAGDKELCRQALLHEETHYRQRDHIWTALRIFLCIFYWWNPLVWLGAACARDDAEFACDARALWGVSLSERKAYGYALLEILGSVKSPGPLVQGTASVSGKGKYMEKRLEGIVSEGRKTKLWGLAVGGLFLLFFCGFCFPVQGAGSEEMINGEIPVQSEASAGWEEGPGAEVETQTGRESAGEMKVRAGEESARGVSGELEAEESSVGSAGEKNGKASTGILLHSQGHRTGYREPRLHYTASADWLTDLSGRPEEQEQIEQLADRAIRELYDLTGYQVEECFYGYHEIGMLFFGRTEEDIAHSRMFCSYSLGEKDGYDIISSIDIVSRRRVWYSDVEQLALPENAASMTKEELAVWFLERSPFQPEGRVVEIGPVFEDTPNWLRLTMEDGTFYEVGLDMKILAVENIYGPYPAGASH